MRRNPLFLLSIISTVQRGMCMQLNANRGPRSPQVLRCLVCLEHAGQVLRLQRQSQVESHIVELYPVLACCEALSNLAPHRMYEHTQCLCMPLSFGGNLLHCYGNWRKRLSMEEQTNGMGDTFLCDCFVDLILARCLHSL